MSNYVELEPKSDGNNFPKILLPRESTVGLVTDVSYWSGSKRLKNPDGTTTEKPSEKIIITVTVDKDKVVSCWQTAKVAKGSKPQFNTLSYTNAENLGLLDKFKKDKDKIKSLEDMATFWRDALLDKKIKFVPEIVIPENGQRYSIIKIIDNWA